MTTTILHTNHPTSDTTSTSLLSASNWQQPLEDLMASLSAQYLADEASLMQSLVDTVAMSESQQHSLSHTTTTLVEDVRQQQRRHGNLIDDLLQQYSLSTHEGLQLMCLAEALLRVPDKATCDALIEDKLGVADWQAHLGKSTSWMVNASSWSLLLTGRVLTMDKAADGRPAGALRTLVNRLGEPVVRRAMMQMMKIMGHQFVLGRHMKEALKRSQKRFAQGYTYSYDMLGEAAMTAHDAERYFTAYFEAITAAGNSRVTPANNVPPPSISIKLSALHPRYSVSQSERVMRELVTTVRRLVQHARSLGVALTIDAEEADRLELSLALFEAVYRSPDAKGWGGLGLVVQAYSKRALPTLYWLTQLSDQQGDEIPVRLVKGAYWDAEIKLAQQLGLEGYPVFTRKAGTDVSFLACTHYLLSDNTRGRLFPQFGSHNAHTLASILAMVGDRRIELQRLHGMGESLYDALLAQAPEGVYCRIYAPVGAHKELLPYLVRRLLENGANSSFVHQLLNPNVPAEQLSQHPLMQLASRPSYASTQIVPPRSIYGPQLPAAKGINMNIRHTFDEMTVAMQPFMDQDTQWQATPLLGENYRLPDTEFRPVTSPFDTTLQVGEVQYSDADTVKSAIDIAERAFPAWSATPVDARAAILERFADALEAHMPELVALCTREAGKQLNDGIADVREAVDFCRYYADQARLQLAHEVELPGPTGELNTLSQEGRGIFATISPWNFPVAIFCGQTIAAAVAGNTVLAKPAEQTSLCAYRVMELLYDAGMPQEVVQLLPGSGAEVGAVLTSDPRIAGIAFTGSNATATHINRALAERDMAPLPVLIAETGGLNAMLVDATALPEQVIRDVIESAFQSAGQRCSALRMLYVQEDIADGIFEALQGAMRELSIGNPGLLQTDVGPVIDASARDKLTAYVESFNSQDKVLYTCSFPEIPHGNFVAPVALRVNGIEDLESEQFGPILHIATYKANEVDKVLDAINAKGYGLTFGIHTRNNQFAEYVANRVRVGNVYVNRNVIGAVVGVQPFGGCGLSGTGPKAGGPHYLQRFVTEKTRTVNTAAQGGNASLLAMGD